MAGETGLTKAQLMVAARVKAVAAQASGQALDSDGRARRPFNADELDAIFSQEQFKSGDGSHMSKGRSRCDPHEYWAPLLSFLHGLRLREVTQLSLDCIREIDGIWCLHVNALAVDRRVKNTRKIVQLAERCVPIHPLAIELGLLKGVVA